MDKRSDPATRAANVWILDAAGDPVPAADALQWAQWFATSMPARIVAHDTIDDVRVSTVFLGIDHQWTAGGPPLLYETLIFGGEYDGRTWRYTTRAQAQAGHARACELLRPH